MKWKDTNPREYYQKYEKLTVQNHQNWFDVYRLPENVYAICEPQHFQEVNAYLIIGSKKALLLDTGMGICNIKLLVEELYQGELIVVNSHFHFDHIGDNHRFEEVYIFDDPYAKKIAAEGLPCSALGDQLEESMFLFDYPKDFQPKNFSIPPYNIITIKDGHIFDLGNRTLRVLHTPGHSNDSIMLYDEKKQILFTGDSFYLGALYAHFHCNEFGHSNLKDYLNSMNQLLAILPNVTSLYCSHNDFIASPSKIEETAQALAQIIRDEGIQKNSPAEAHQYLEAHSKLREYLLNDFSIVYEDTTIENLQEV